MWFSKKKEETQGIVGIDLGVGGIKLVELAAQNGRARLETYGFTEGFLGIAKETMEESAAAKEADKEKKDEGEIKRLSAVLRELIEKCGTKSKTAIASIPISSVFGAVVTLNRTEDKAQIDAALRQEAKKLLPLPLEEVILDYSKLPDIFTDMETARKNQMKLLMTAAPRTVIARYTAIFKGAGLTLKSLETESFALVHALVGNDPAAIMVLDIGFSRTNLYLIRGRVPLMHRSINIGGRNFNKVLMEKLNVSEQDAEQIKIDMAAKREGTEMLDIFKPAVDPIVQEIKYHMQLFEKQLGGASARPEKIILTGGSSLLPHLDVYLEEYFKMRAYVGDPWARIIYPDVLKMALDQIGPRFGIAIGLALAEIVPQK